LIDILGIREIWWALHQAIKQRTFSRYQVLRAIFQFGSIEPFNKNIAEMFLTKKWREKKVSSNLGMRDLQLTHFEFYFFNFKFE